MGQWGTHVATEGRIAFDVSFEVDAFVGHTTSLGVSGYLPEYDPVTYPSTTRVRTRVCLGTYPSTTRVPTRV